MMKTVVAVARTRKMARKRSFPRCRNASYGP